MIRIQLERREEVQQDTSLGLGGRLRAISRKRAQRKKDSSPPPPAPGGGRDPLAHRDTDKAEFFKRGGNWRSVAPTDWTPYRPGGAA